MATARFAYTIVYVPDVAAAAAFYESAFGCAIRFITESGDYAELDTGDVTLSFASEGLADSNLPDGYHRHTPGTPPLATELCFVSDEIDTIWQQAISAGATVVTEPVTKPWGQTLGYVRDPQGVLIEIATPISA